VTDDRSALESVAGTEDADGGHVDHVVFGNDVARAREAFLRDTVPRFAGYERPVVNLELTYEDELFPGDRVTGTIEVRAIGDTSLTTLVTLTPRRRDSGHGSNRPGILDPATGDPTPVPDDWRVALR
jgi:acyl-CoA thioesterase FadM